MFLDRRTTMKKFLTIFIISALYISYLPTASSAEGLPLQPKVHELTSAELANNPSNQLIIKFKDSITKSQKEAILQKYQLEELSTIKNGNISLVSLPTDSNLMKISDLLTSLS